VFSDIERLVQTDQHAFVTLSVIGRGEGESHVYRRDRTSTAMGNGGNADNFGLPFELFSITSNTYDLAKVDVIVVAIEDKDPIGRGRITITGQVLEI
jgi:hypothetical protein